MRRPRRNHSEACKAKVAIAAVKDDQTLAALAERYDVHPNRDLERGGPLEVRWLSGGVVARGRRLSIATPCNRTILDILSVRSEGTPA